ncbi:hypothetical protein [Lentibacillus amyloliquefaciens]|uniref:Uncharacterized protein n=1 Tax=Lentibacillus amyloliquefaciens TaxID=1472767 RepID=A0A0U3WDH0_9BACI|nr:hypothetical protein [Lentibacillus amyloliquefaciens]ALX47855.1 hypothetical protein AOX59_04100 [Lentibacillus amyloliquefaciens]
MSEENFTHTDEQVQEAIQNAKAEWQEQELNPIVAERDDLMQYKPHEPTDAEKEFQQKQTDLFNKQVDFELKQAGLADFKEVVKINDEEELSETVKSLGKVVNKIKVDSGYVPENHARDDEYSKFEKDGNTQGMIGTKLANLFK